MLAAQDLVQVLLHNIIINIVSTRKGIGIDIIGHMCIGMSSKVGITVNAGLNASIGMIIKLFTNININASTSMIISISITISGR